MPKHAKPEPADDGRLAPVLENCTCSLVMDTSAQFIAGRRSWEPECPMHGVKARVSAGIWPQEVADLWYKTRAHLPV